MWLPVLIAVLGLGELATPEREAEVVEACAAWLAGVAASELPVTHRVAPDGLCFAGRITTESATSFVQALSAHDPAIPLVVVLSSWGGEVNAGMAMGEALFPLTTTVVAHRTCVSSCANYPFLAGDRRVIGKDALLGYHGGIPDTPEQHWIDLRSEYSQRMSPQEVEQSMVASRAASDVQVDRQDAFLEMAGVDVDLFRWMAGFNELAEAQKVERCPVNGASLHVYSDAVLAERKVVVHENHGPKSDAELVALLAARNEVGLACYSD